jgi:hypothetical protein
VDGLIVGAIVGLVATVAGTVLGYGLLSLLRRTQKRPQQNCPRCGRPGGERATPSGRGATLSIAAISVLALLLVCGLPYVLLSALMLATGGIDASEIVLPVLILVGGLALGYGAVRYVNWYRSFPLVKCACGWRPAEAEA